MAATPPFPPLRDHFLREGLLLPARNPALFARVMALTVAETALKVYLVMLLLDVAQDVIIVAVVAAYYLTLGAAVRAITTSAAVATCGVDNETDAPTFRQVVAKALYGGGGVTVATAIHVQILAIACELGAAALAFLAVLLVSYTRTLLLLDLVLLVVLIVSIARLYIHVVLSVALVLSASEPGRHHLTAGAALRRAWVLTAEKAGNAVICVLADTVLAAVTSPRQWHTTTPSGEPLELVRLLISCAGRVLSVCAVTAYYYDCRRRVQEPPAERQLIATGKEWLISLSILCSNKFQEILQGRCSVRRMLATLRAHLKRWSIWMVVFVSNNPWVASVAVLCAGGLITEGPPAIFYQNSLVSYRNFLRRKYHIYPANNCVGRG
ncbi:hypothetical protein BS78_07G100600 [Paspalum vaginatum]|nr:hypothetical protein BS78_07G100600 [Paspalum vaginatum]